MRYIMSSATTSLIAASLLTASSLHAEVPRVVTDIPPVHALVAQVMGDLGAPVLLLDKGGNEHDLQLSPSQVRALAGAGLVVWIGPELTPWLDRALTATSTAERLGLLAVPGTTLRAFAPDEAGDQTASGTDPHAWLDPENARHWLAAIAGALSRQDPANAATYAANATGARAGIAALDAELRESLSPLAALPFVTYHDAYGAFVDHYGLTWTGSLAEGDATRSGAAQISALAEQIAAGRAVCLFPEVQHDSGLIAQLAEAGNARLGATLDPVGVTLPPGPDTYAALMRGLASALADCLRR